MQYNILTSVPICPVCSAGLRKFHIGSEIIYRCKDCKREFTVIEAGHSDRELKVVDKK